MKIYHNTTTFISYFRQMRGLFLPHMTVKKFLNFLSLAADNFLCREKTKSHPAIFKFEVSGACNLRCALCMHGKGAKKEAAFGDHIMSLETFNRILDQVSEYALFFFMYHKGEPFINKQILDMCESAEKKKVATVLSSNFSLPLKDADFTRIVESGLSYLIVSLDGVSQNVYEKYRQGGKVDLVIENVKKLIAEKKRLRSKTPIICWQFIKFDHNSHEIPLALETAEKIGVDHFAFQKNLDTKTVDEFESLGSGVKSDNRLYEIPSRCKWLWSTAIFLHDGEVVPCCYYDWKRSKHFGNAVKEPFSGIWNNGKYRVNRQLSCGKVPVNQHLDTHCAKCPLTEPE